MYEFRDSNMSTSFEKMEVNTWYLKLLQVLKVFLWSAGVKIKWGGTEISCFIFILKSIF